MGKQDHPHGAMVEDVREHIQPGIAGISGASAASGRIDQVLLGLLTRRAGGVERDVPLDRIAEQVSTIEEFFTSGKFTHRLLNPNSPE